jgi:hypothetical protein
MKLHRYQAGKRASYWGSRAGNVVCRINEVER